MGLRQLEVNPARRSDVLGVTTLVGCQWAARRLRGLPADPAFGPVDTMATEPSADVRPFGVIPTGHDDSFWVTDPEG